MQPSRQGIVIGTFKDRAEAEKAIDELHHAGFVSDQVSFLSRSGELKEARTATTVQEDQAGDGAATGAIAGGVAGAAAGALALSLVPGLGLVVTGGMLTVLLVSLAAGATGGTLIGPFIALGLSEDEARYCENEFKAGRSILVVRAGERKEEAGSILRHNGATSEESSALALPPSAKG